MSALRPTSALRAALVAVCLLSVTTAARTSVWPTAAWIGDSAAGRALARVITAPRFGLGGSPPPPAPGITATKAGAFPAGGDVDADGKADPGDTIRYTVTISDVTDDATGVHLADTPDPNTTFVGGSLVISPLAINDVYASVGNMTLVSATIAGSCGGNPLRSVTCNDILNGGSLTGFGATQGTAAGTVVNGSNTVATSTGGTVLLNADGTFVYNPAAGFEGADTFWYTLTSPGGIAGTDAAQVTINVGGVVNGMVWFVTSGGVGTGRQANPISLDGLRLINTGSGNSPNDNDTIFLFEGAHALTATLILRTNQKLLGQDSSVALTMLGAPPAQLGNTYPTLDAGGATVSITSSAAALTLGSDNELSGFTVGNATTAITGSAVGALNVRDVVINTNGQGLIITTSGTATTTPPFTGFTSVTSTGGANGVSLVGVDGTLALGSGDLTGNTGAAFNVSGGNATINYSGTIRNSGGRQVSIVNKTGGTVTFSGAVSGTGTGIFLDNNDQSGVAAIAFAGGVTLSTGANNAFTATNGGVVTLTGGSNSITTTTGTPLNVANTSVGLAGLTFLSISANGASNGIILNTTGTTAGVNGGLTVTGTGTTAGSGGTIQNIANRGASFITVRDISLKNMNFTNANTSDNASPEPAVSTGGNANVNAAIHINGVTNITLDRLAISGAVQQGINGLSTTGFTLSNSTLSNLGNEADEDGIHFFNMLGTASITNTTITSSGDDNVNIQNASGTANITITGGSFNTGVLGSGLLFGPRGTTNTTITIAGVTSNNNFSGGIVADASDTATMDIEVSGSTVTNNNDGIQTSCASGTCKADIHDNVSFAGNDFVVITMLKAAFSVGGTFNGRIHNNPIPVADNRTTDAIVVNQVGGGAMLVAITNNTITYRGTQRPILLQAGQDGNGSLDATITGNSIDIQLDGTLDAVGILAQASITSPSGNGASACFDIGGAGALRNAFTHSLGGVIAGGDLRVRQRFEPTFVRLPGYGGGAMDNTAAAAYLNARNTVVSATTATVDTVGGGGAGDIVGPGFSGGAACNQPNLALNTTGREREYLARADGPNDRPRVPAIVTDIIASALAIPRFVTSGSSSLIPRLKVAFPADAITAVNRLRGFVSPLLAQFRHAVLHQLSAAVEASPQPPAVDVDVAATLPAGKTIRVVFDVTVNAPPVAQYSNFATVTGSNFSPVTTNTVNTPGDRFNTTTALVSSLNPADQGVPVTFTATVTPTQGAVTPDGTVQFTDNGSNIGSAVTCASAPANTCTAQVTTSSLLAGTRSIVANYLGGSNHDPSTSNTVSQVIVPCTTNPVVTTNADSGAGSLRQAIADACVASTITFSGAVTSIGLTSGQLTIPRSLTISGPGANVVTVQRTSGTFRLFTITTGTTVTISGLTLANGLASGVFPANAGGGILNDHGTLTITNSALSGNTAGSGGGVYNNGDTTSASLTITGSTLSGNTATVDGGGVFNLGSGGGTATLTIANSTISGNMANHAAGGVWTEGSTITSAPTTITNATITNNRADADGNDTGPHGGGLGVGGSDTVVLQNTLVARNVVGASPGTTADDIVGELDAVTSFNNLIGDGTNMTGVTQGSSGNQVGTSGSPIDPRLGALAANGGRTQTHALLVGSPALDAGDNTLVVGTTDQRGTGFNRIRDAADANTTQTVDIGAVEADPTVEDITDKLTTEDAPLAVLFNVGDAATAFDSISATSSNTTLVPNAPANLTFTGSGSSRTLTLTPALNQFGTTTITVTATKTITGTPVSMSDTFVLTVLPVADTPSVTSATTFVNTQTTSGLVLSRNGMDGAEIGFFKITGITNGTLFHTDGTTSITNNAFITVAQGSAGLKFTPTTDSTATGSFEVQGSVDGIGTGLSTGFATATITVNLHATATTITSDTPDPSDRNAPVTVAYSVVSTDGGPTPTGTVTVTVSGGSETCSATVAAGQCAITLTVAGVNRTITASYGGDSVSGTSSDTELHTVNNCPAAPIVTTTADSGAGSLRQAVADACTTDTITFNIAGAGPHTIGLTTGELTLDKNLTITGPTATSVRISGTNASRILTVNSGKTVSVSNLTLMNGSAAGGGALVNLGTLSMTSSTLSGNAATANGGAIRNDGSLTLTNSTLSGNTVTTDGGGISNTLGANLTLVNATIAANTAGGSGGGIANAGALTLENSIVASNTATTSGPNLSNSGGTVTDGGHNLLTGDPQIGPLQNNGGPTFTHALRPGSPALEAGDTAAAAAAGLTTDQRGPGFARVLDAADANTAQAVDIGAFEADPSVEDITDKTTDEDTPLTFTFNVGDSTTPFDAITATSSNTTLVPNANATIGANTPSTRTLTLTPVADLSGTTTITVTATKTISGTIVSMSDTFVLTVAAVNDQPTLNAIPDPAAILEDAGLQTVNLTGITAGGGETQILTVTATSNNTALIPHPTVTYTTPATTGSLGYTPVANASGSATIMVTVTDNGGGTNTFSRTFTVAVTAVNDPPTLNAIPNPAALLEDAGTQTVNLTGISAGGGETQALTVTATSNNTSVIPHPTVTYTSPDTTGALSYAPVANASGMATITVTVTDSGGGTNTVSRTFTVDVTAVNDLPTISNIADRQVAANMSTSIPFTVGDVETAASALTITAVSSNQAVVPDAGLVVGAGGASRTLTLTPAPNQTGTATITVTVTDGNGESASDAFVVTVVPALTIADATAVEGDSGSVNLSFTVTLSGPAANPVSVGYATRQRTAIEGVDYIGRSGTLTFAAGAGGTATIVVTARGDTTTEIDETFFVELSGAQGGALITDGQAVGTITNDDPTDVRTAELVSWMQPLEVTAVAGRLTKTGSFGGWSAGAISRKGILTGNGSVEFSATTNDQDVGVGLSTDKPTTDIGSLEFGIELFSNGAYYIIEGGVYPPGGGFAPYAAGDRFAVTVAGGVVSYQRNGITFYTSSGVPQYPLRVDASLLTPGATIADVVLAGRLGDQGGRAGDFDGDSKADIAVYRPASATWYVLRSQAGYTTYSAIQFGVSGDIPVPGDYDGDGAADIAVYRPSTGMWHILPSATGFTTPISYQWGNSTDIPVPGDYDGDGKTDLGVYRPATGTWYIELSSSNYTTFVQYQWGVSSDAVVPGDYDGDGRADLGVYRPASGTWFILQSSSNFTTSVSRQWGVATDITVPGDYDGDGKNDLAIFRPSTGTWYLLQSSTGDASYLAVQWGANGDVPVRGDYDGDGKADLAVWRPSTGGWWVLKSSTGYMGYLTYSWGVASDIAVLGR